MPETLRMREVNAGGWTLVTKLTDAKEVSKHDLYELYRARWQVELDLRSIKTLMRMEVLRCKSPQMVKKEIAVHLLAYNLVRAVMAQAAHLLAGIAQLKLLYRTGRVEPRALKRRPKPFQLLTEPRQALRARLMAKQQQHIAACLS